MTARGSILLLIALLAAGAGLAWFWQQGASELLGQEPVGEGHRGTAARATAGEASLILAAGEVGRAADSRAALAVDADSLGSLGGADASAAQLVGLVSGPDTQPLEGATVWVTTRGSRVPLGLESDDSMAKWTGVMGSGSDGRFAMPLTEEGPVLVAGDRLRVLARAPRHMPLRVSSQTMSIEPPHDLGTLSMTLGATATGRVSSPSGQPVAGARVFVSQAETRGLLSVSYPSRGLELASTDEEGSFECTELRPGPFEILVEAEGYAPGAVGGEAQLKRPLTGLSIILQRGQSIAGSVLGVPDGALEGLLVRAAPTQESEVPQSLRRIQIVPVASDGAFTIEGLLPQVTYQLRLARAGPYGVRNVRSSRSVEALAGATGVELSWPVESSLIGRVVAMGAEGLAPVESFIIYRANGSPEGTEFDAQSLKSSAGATITEHPGGAFRFDAIQDRRRRTRTYSLRVRAPGYEDLIVRGVEVPHGEAKDLGDLALSPGESFQVTVLDDKSGDPVESAQVYLAAKKNDRWFQRWWGRSEKAYDSDTVRYGETDAAGVIDLQRPPGTDLRLGVQAAGYVAAGPLNPKDTDKTKTVRLLRGADVIAEVVGPSGEPVPRAAVTLTLDGARVRGERELTAQTDDTGRARFESIPEGNARVAVSPPSMRPRRPMDWAETSTSVAVPATGEVVATVTAIPMAAVTGIVTVAGLPLGAARLSFDVREGTELLRPERGSVELRAVTTATGRFRLPAVPHGEYELAVSHRSRAMVNRVPVVIGQGTPELIIALVDTSLSGSIVSKSSGKPLSDVRVQVSGLGGSDRAFIGQRTYKETSDGDIDTDEDWLQPGRVTTDASGRFEFKGMASGEPVLVQLSGNLIRGESHTVEALAVGESRTGVVLEARPAGAVRVTLDRSQGTRRGRSRPYAKLVRLDGGGNPTGRPRSQNGRGSAYFGSVRPGRYRITTHTGASPDELLETKDVEVTAGRQLRVTMRAQ